MLITWVHYRESSVDTSGWASCVLGAAAAGSPVLCACGHYSQNPAAKEETMVLVVKSSQHGGKPYQGPTDQRSDIKRVWTQILWLAYSFCISACPRRKGGFKTKDGQTSRALTNFVSSQMVIICILKNRGKKGCFVVCLGFRKALQQVSPDAEYWLQILNAVVSTG